MKRTLSNQSVYTLGLDDKPPATHRFVTGACLCPRATCELAGVWSDVWVGSRLQVPVNGTAMDLMIRPGEMQKNAILNEDPTPKPHDTSRSPYFTQKSAANRWSSRSVKICCEAFHWFLPISWIRSSYQTQCPGFMAFQVSLMSVKTHTQWSLWVKDN